VADYIVRVLDDKKGEDIHLMNIQELSILADYFVICSGTSVRMVNALMTDLMDEVKKEFELIPRLEGEATAGWMLADYGNVIVHIFSPDRRDYYSLEELWAEAKTILRLQ
jgi:ribosome-associated protein